MNTMKRKSLVIAVLAAVAAPFAYVAKRHGERFCVAYAKDADEVTSMGDVMKALEEKFGEVRDHIKKVQDDTTKAIEDVRKEGVVYAKSADELKANGEKTVKLQDEITGLKAKFLELEQKGTRGHGGGDPSERKTAGTVVAESPEWKRMIESKEWKMAPVAVERKAIINATGASQPLVPADRIPGIIMPATRRLTLRDLIPSIPTDSNLIEFCRELVFTNSAGPQYDGTSPAAATEGAMKNESGITFELDNAAVITIAHYIAASRQVLKDAKQLRGYIDTRLEYGLKLEEEDEILNSTGTSGELDGLRNQQTAYSYGTTNDSNIDALLRAFLQVSLSYYEASAAVLHPTNWAGIMLAKDTTGRYLFSDPHSAEAPRIWGKPVLATATMPVGKFQVGAYDMACAIYDNEQVSIRMSDQHDKFFVQNMVAILCEERLALAVYRAAAIVGGDLPGGV